MHVVNTAQCNIPKSINKSIIRYISPENMVKDDKRFNQALFGNKWENHTTFNTSYLVENVKETIPLKYHNPLHF